MSSLPRRVRGDYLNTLWGVGAAHALYIHDGHWYHKLKRFPGALLDRNGYVRFDTEDDYLTSPYLQIRKQISVPGRISSMPGYVQVPPFLRAVAETALDATTFDIDSIDDARRRTAQAIVQRQGQPGFRLALLRAYGSRCCITGFDAVQALEAAHIHPYLGPKTNHASNGLLLRADLHALFDQGLIGIDPATMAVIIAPALYQTAYADLSGVKVSTPTRAADAPSKAALTWHRQQYGL
jgi:hypothetical protein